MKRTLLALLGCGLAAATWTLSARTDLSREMTPPPSPKREMPMNVLFADDFADGDLEGWRADATDYWTVRRGMLRVDLPDRKQVHSLLRAGDLEWTDYALDFDVCAVRGVDKGAVVRVRGQKGLGLDLRGPGYNDFLLNVRSIPVGRAPAINGNSVWHHVRIEVRGDRCRVRINDEEPLERRLPGSVPPSGAIALAAYTGGVGECTVYFDNVVVTPLP